MESYRDSQVEEAVARMKLLGILKNPIKEFKNDGVINRSENVVLYWLDDEEKQMVADFEKKMAALYIM